MCSILKFKFLKEHLLAIIISSFLITYSICKTYSFYFIYIDKLLIFLNNIKIYFITLFDSDLVIGNQILDILKDKVASGELVSIIPESITNFIDRFAYSFRVLFSNGYLYSELILFFNSFRVYSILLTFLILLIPLIIILNRIYFTEESYLIDNRSSNLKKWDKINKKIFIPLKEKIFQLIQSVANKNYFKISLILSVVIYFNVINIFTDFISYYFAFLTNFDFNLLWDMFYVLFIDIAPVLIELPLWFYILIIYIFICNFRKNLAIDILQHNELLNCGFIKSSGVMIMINGAPGSGKTKLMTDISLTCEMMFRNQAKDIMDEVRNLFPNFRWDLLRKQIDLNVKLGKIKSLVDVELFIQNNFYGRIMSSIQFNPNHYYSFDKYNCYFNNYLKYESLYEDIIDYAKAYFVYQNDFSLILSNYPIRADHIECGNQHMKKWNYNYFVDQCSDLVPEGYSKIIDYDMLRLSKSKDKDNLNKAISIAYVISLTEFGKERGNNLENQELKKSSSETNQKNDGLTEMLRVGRHPATIRHRTFIKIIFDEQRASSCGIALSGITEDIITIDKKNMEVKNSMHFYFIKLCLIKFGCSISSKFLSKHEELRNDFNLIYIFFAWLSKISWKAYLYYKNNYSYEVIYFYLTNGSLSEFSKDNKTQKYYLSYKKIYSERYSSDYLRTFFDLKSSTSKKGIGDLYNYGDIYPTFEEIELQNSYFGDSLKKNLLTRDDD